MYFTRITPGLRLKSLFFCIYFVKKSMSDIEKKYPVTSEVKDSMATIKRGVDTRLIEED